MAAHVGLRRLCRQRRKRTKMQVQNRMTIKQNSKLDNQVVQMSNVI